MFRNRKQNRRNPRARGELAASIGCFGTVVLLFAFLYGLFAWRPLPWGIGIVALVLGLPLALAWAVDMWRKAPKRARKNRRTVILERLGTVVVFPAVLLAVVWCLLVAGVAQLVLSVTGYDGFRGVRAWFASRYRARFGGASRFRPKPAADDPDSATKNDEDDSE